MKVGIIGYGRFGKLATRFVARYTRVQVFDSNARRTAHLPRNVARGSLEEAAACDIVVLAVPISSLKTTLRSIAPLVLPGALVADVCSVKTQPLQWMMKILPHSTHIVGMHPLFGPDSVQRSLQGHHLVMCPGRISATRLRDVRRALSGTGLIVTKMTTRDHDRMMAETLFLTQMTGRVISGMSLRRHDVSTKAYEHLMNIVRIADNDSSELFHDMFAYNPFASTVLRRMIASTRRVAGELQ